MKKAKLKLSACWIARNEEDNIQRSIESVKGQVDELIMVDTGSTDRTIEIAEQLGAKIFHFEWADDFSAPRNYAIEQAKGDWIVFLDADEYFAYPDKVRRGVKKFAVKDTILIPRININPDKNNREGGRDWNARIFRRAPNLRYMGMIHENITRLDKKIEYVFSDESLLTYHTGYRSSQIEDKLRRNLRLIKLEMERYGHKTQHDIALVDCYFGLKDYEKAIEHAKRALASDFDWVIGKGNVYHRLLDAMRKLNYPDEEMLPIAEAAIRDLPHLPEFYAERGMILGGLNRFDESYLDLHKALEVWKNMPPSMNDCSYFEGTVGKIYARLGRIELLVGNVGEARKNFMRALEREPNNEEYRQQLERLKE